MTGRTNAGGGVQLPALTNPAAAGNIQSGYQAINGEGEVMAGTAAVRETVTATFTNLYNTYVYVATKTGVQTISRPRNEQIQVLANSIMGVYFYKPFTISGDVTPLEEYQGSDYMGIFQVGTGDFAMDG